jgi:UDP-N-acetylglucosamine 4-epimerase
MPFPNLKNSEVLVTGGAGFIGSHLTETLVRLGAHVRVLDNLSTGKRTNVPTGERNVSFIEADIRDLDACHKACQGVRYVFHQAALGSIPRSLSDPSTSIAVNVSGTANVFAAARDAKVQRVVFASSSSVYGDSPILPRREGEEGRVLSPYALSKVMDERLAEVFGGCFEMEIIGLRYFNIYGPRQDPSGPYAAVIPLFFMAHLSGQAPYINGDGSYSRDFTFIQDAVNANLLAAGAPSTACGRSYNIGAGGRTTISHLEHLVREITGSSIEPVTRPNRPGDVPHSHADLTLAQQHLAYEPDTTIEDGISRTLPFYRDQF